MRNVLAAVVALIVAISVGSAIAGGGSKAKDPVNKNAAEPTSVATTVAPTTVATTAAAPTTAPTKTAAPTTTKPRAPAHKPDLRAGLGDSITMTDNDGYKFSVTLVKVSSHPHSTDEFDTPDAGMRYYAAQFRVHALTGNYSDSPSNGAKAVDSEGQSYDTTIVDTISAGQQFSAQTTIVKGDTGLGWLVFEVAKSAKIVKVQFGLDSGFSDTGEWFTRTIDHS